MSPEHYLIDLLTEADVSLSEALRAFGGDEERTRAFLSIQANKQAIAFLDGDSRLPEWRVRELLRESRTFRIHGDLMITLSPHGLQRLQEGNL